MDSQRQQKFARLIQRDLGEIFQRDTKHLFDGAFITVTGVRISPDLGVASIYLSFLLAKNPRQTLDDIKEQSKPIRTMLGAKIRHQARIIPHLRFFLDDTAEQAAKIDDLLSKLVIPPVAPEDYKTYPGKLTEPDED
jgi:ribosome-binding factor A